MGTVGFDVPRLTALAGSVTSSVPGLGLLDREITTLRSNARALMGGAPMPSDAGVPSPHNDEIGMGLLDLSTEIKRRLQLITAMQALKRLGLGLDLGTDPMALDLVDDAKVAKVVQALKDLPGKDGGFNGNRDDIGAVQQLVDSLNPEELDKVVDGLSDDDLKRLGDVVRDTDDSGWSPFDHNGLERPERFEFFSSFLSRVSPSRIPPIVKAFPEVNPGFDTTDAALEGQNPQTGAPGDGLHYGTPPGQLWRVGPDGKPAPDASDSAQGVFGDCWFIASMMSAQAADKSFISDHMQQNPNGTISVKMYDKDGDAHWTTVTKELPLDSSGQVAGAHGTALWPGYYEKAFAQLYTDDDGGAPDDHEGDDRYDRTEVGSYGALEWDFAKNAAPYITGHGADDEGHDFDAAARAHQDGNSVLISTKGDAPTPPGEWGTSYSTRHVYYVKSVDGDKITVGNPWGSPRYPDITMTKDQFDTYFDDVSTMDKADQ